MLFFFPWGRVRHQCDRQGHPPGGAPGHGYDAVEAGGVPLVAAAYRRVGKAFHEVGYRLGQMSEFSLLLAVLALETGVIGARPRT